MRSPDRDPLVRAFLEGFRPPERLTVSEWAEKYRILSGRAASEPGRWRTSRTPYLREIMDALSPQSDVEQVVVMAGAQIGKTECGNNWIGATITQDPSTMLVVWQSLDVARVNSKLRIDPLIESTPELFRLVRKKKDRDSGNTILAKEFPGGILLITGANATGGLRSTPVGKLFLDEVDAYKANVNHEGDPLELALVRTRNFSGKKKVLITSTPTIEGSSRIQTKFFEGDQRFFEVPCPFCEHYQTLVWINLRWEEDDPNTARYFCRECGSAIEEAPHKTNMLARGRWVATNPKAPPAVRSYHLSALYSPLGWYSWAHAARDFLRTKHDARLLQIFTNTVLGETFKVRGDAPDWERLFNRRENYKIGTVPAGGLALTAGADVQKDRIEVEVVAWGRNSESWSVAYHVFPGDTEGDAPWTQLEELLAHTFPHERGGELRIRCLAVDCSYNQNRVLSWTRTQPSDRVLATKARGRYATLIGHAVPVDVETDGRKIRRGAKLWTVGVDHAKSELYGWLKAKQPTDPSKGFPRGFCHFPLYGEEYFRQLCAEQLVARGTRGRVAYEWDKIRERNEALDCRNYARAAAAVQGVDRMSDAQWARLERALGVEVKPKPRQATPAAAGQKTPPAEPERPAQTGLPKTPKDFWKPWQSGPKPT